MRHDSALKVAESLVEYFRPACMRIEIAGSVRRGKPEVKDIEIVAIPDLSPPPPPKLEFGKPPPVVYRTLLDMMVVQMASIGDIHIMKNGDRYKQIYLKYAGICLDLFLVLPPAQWGVQMVIRTGPADFSHWLVTRKSKGGGLPDDAIVEDGVVGNRIRNEKGFAREGEIPMSEEIDFLKFCGLGWIEPKDRVARWGR